jgi:signal transduction histidine kinase
LQIGERENIPRDIIVNGLEPISLLNQKVLAIARFATKANFRIQSEFTEEDLSDYIASYIDGVAKEFLGGNIDILVESDSKEFRRKFKPIDVSIVVDNLISNARKARASKITFDLKQPRKGLLEITVSDNGRGIAPVAAVDSRLFEKGFSTTDGSGLGLYHIRQVLDEMGGSIEVLETNENGTKFLLRIPT